MDSNLISLLDRVRADNPSEPEFYQAVEEVLDTLAPLLTKHPEYRVNKLLERMVEPERTIIFRIPWVDDQGEVQVNRGFRVEMNSSLGPYKGGLRFHPSVNLGILKFLALEQVFKNALTGLPLGGGKGGSDFDSKGKSDEEVMRFCQSFMSELFRHIGPNTDIPAGDIGVGGREIGYLFGQYRRIRNEFTGVLTGKGMGWVGSLILPEATGYGVVYFAAEMLAARYDSLEGKTCLVSGAGNVAQLTAEKLLELGAVPITLSDSTGYIYDETGIDASKLAYVKRLKNERRGRILKYAEEYPEAVYTEVPMNPDVHPLWNHEADCAFPCATENEITATDAHNLLNNGIMLVCEGANMPTMPEGADLFMDTGILYGPAKAANAGGVAVSGLEMSQNSMRVSWSRDEVDGKLKTIMKNIQASCLEAAKTYAHPSNYVDGANITGFLKVANAMLDQGVI